MPADEVKFNDSRVQGEQKVYLVLNKPKGYVTSLDKDKHINIGVDGGVMFWGGTPKVVTHENVNLTEDVSDIAGKVGSYVRTVRDMKVYPVLNFRIAYRFGK